MAINREHAIRTTLLMLPNNFKEIDLYMGIASLSYIGDPRMFIGENPKKVHNLVTPLVPTYRNLYQDSISLFGKYLSFNNNKLNESNSKSLIPNSVISLDLANASRMDLCLGLPQNLKNSLALKHRLVKDVIPPTQFAIRSALSKIVARSSTQQSLKGILTAGLVKCSQYVIAKIGKRFVV